MLHRPPATFHVLTATLVGMVSMGCAHGQQGDRTLKRHSAAAERPPATGAAADAAASLSTAPLSLARFDAASFQSQRSEGRAFSDSELSVLADSLSLEVEQVEPGVLRLLDDRATYLLFNLKDGDLQLYFAAAGARVDLEAINRWNVSHRLSRAYVDGHNDPILEADLLSDGGLTAERVRAFISVFALSRRAFSDFVASAPQEKEERSTPDRGPSSPEQDPLLTPRIHLQRL